MIAAFRRNHPQIAFLALAIVVNAIAAGIAKSRPAQIGACLDMTVTVTALYYWLMVRPGFRPKSGMILIALLGLLRASMVFPAVLPGKFWIATGLEIGLVAAIAIGIRRAPQNADPTDRMRAILAGILPFSGGERALAGELSVLYYAFAWRARPHMPVGTKPFTLHKREGFNDLILMIGLASLLEVVPVHLLIAHWNVEAAWVVTGLSVYGALWALALYRSFTLRPGLIGSGELIVRFGLLFSLKIPFESIRTIGSEAVPGALLVPRRVSPTLYIQFKQPLLAEKMMGFRKPVSAIGFAPDDLREFAANLPERQIR